MPIQGDHGSIRVTAGIELPDFHKAVRTSCDKPPDWLLLLVLRCRSLFKLTRKDGRRPRY